jgi:hypothetical protein
VSHFFFELDPVRSINYGAATIFIFFTLRHEPERNLFTLLHESQKKNTQEHKNEKMR